MEEDKNPKPYNYDDEEPEEINFDIHEFYNQEDPPKRFRPTNEETGSC